MSVTADAIAFRRARDEQVAWRLLRAKNAPFVMAILGEHFTEGTTRIPVPDFVNMVEADLEELRFRTDFEVSLSAAAYCESWRAEGFLVRRPLQQTRQESYELSSGALTAIGFARRFSAPRRAATQSRLAIILSQIDDLAFKTNASDEQRIRVLKEERRRIDERLALLERGEREPVDELQALEQARSIIDLAQEIPADFLRVRDDFEHINKALHETIINDGEGSRDILRDIFDGVDAISQSPSGLSFRGFYQLLRSADSTETLRDNIDVILESDYAADLSAEERRFLRRLMGTMAEQAQDVNATMTSFAHSLRRFVQNRSYQQDRALKRRIDEALSKAHRVLEHYPGLNAKVPGADLELTSTPIAPYSRYVLFNPEAAQAAPALELCEEAGAELSLADLREAARQTEIDFRELSGAVNECLRARRAARDAHAEAMRARALSGAAAEADEAAGEPCVSVGGVLDFHPATQGVASIVGLVVLALGQGRVVEGDEMLMWERADGAQRRALIPRFEFYKEVDV